MIYNFTLLEPTFGYYSRIKRGATFFTQINDVEKLSVCYVDGKEFLEEYDENFDNFDPITGWFCRIATPKELKYYNTCVKLSKV